MALLLRDYRPEDFDTICEIDRRCFPPGIAYSREELRLWLGQPGAFALIAEDEARGRIAGFIVARKARLRAAHVVTIDVLPEYRRARVGARLMEAAHARLRERGAARVRLETSVENRSAIAFYERLGYRIIGRLPRYYLDKIDAWAMLKELSD